VYQESVYTPPPTNPNSEYTYTPTVATPYEEIGLEVGEEFFKRADAKKPKKGFRKMMSFGKGKQKKKNSVGDADSNTSLNRSGSVVSRTDSVSRLDSVSRNRSSTHSSSSYNRDSVDVTPRTSRDMNAITPRTSRDISHSDISLNSRSINDITTQSQHSSEHDIQRETPRKESRGVIYSGINFDEIPVTSDILEEPECLDSTPTSCHKVLDSKDYTPPDNINVEEYVRPDQPTITEPVAEPVIEPVAEPVAPAAVESVDSVDNDLSEVDRLVLSAPAVPIAGLAPIVMKPNVTMEQACFITKPSVADKPPVARKPSISKKPVVTAPVVTAPVVTAPVVTAPIVTTPVVTEPIVRMTPSPSFSEIDEMLGNLSKDLDSFTFGF